MHYIGRMQKRTLNIRLTQDEEDLLAAYSIKTGRTKTDIIRAFIRSLKGK